MTPAPEFLKYDKLFKAVDSGNWKAAEEFLREQPDAVRARISAREDTPLHVAILAGHEKIVDELLKLMSQEDLLLKDNHGSTALSTVAMCGTTKMAEAIFNKNPGLVTVKDKQGKDKQGHIPVEVAAIYGQKELVHYLYPLTPIEELDPKRGTSGSTLLNSLITAEIYDVAFDLMQFYPRLAFTEDGYHNYTIRILAQKPSAFPSGSKHVFWKQWIYSLLSVQPSPARPHPQSPRQGPGDEENITIDRVPTAAENRRSQVLSPLRGLVWNISLYVVPDIKHICDRKLVHVEASKLLDYIFKEIPRMSKKHLEKIGIDEATHDAIKHGIVEFVAKTIEYDHDIIWRKGLKGRTMFAQAIVRRQEKIFSLFYGLGPKKSVIARSRDIFDNNILHLAGKLSPSSQLERVSGTALQMQRELQWFKEVEKIVKPKYKEDFNEHNKTPSDVFTEEHDDLVKKGQKWMKSTAGSCIIVATLIAALMFTTAFTIPGGTNERTGIPIFLGHNLFMVFIIADALSLFSSSASVLMFLGILTSRYAEEDFLKFLPTKLIIGLFSLFFSIATMMIAFGSAVFIMLRERWHWISIPIIVLGTIPTILFAILQFPLLIEMVVYTYGSGIFGNPKYHHH